MKRLTATVALVLLIAPCLHSAVPSVRGDPEGSQSVDAAKAGLLVVEPPA